MLAIQHMSVTSLTHEYKLIICWLPHRLNNINKLHIVPPQMDEICYPYRFKVLLSEPILGCVSKDAET